MMTQRCMRILIVEDNIADARLVGALLEETGLPTFITMVKDGEAAVRFLMSAERGELPIPDLVMLDINLPKMKGHEVLASIRANANLAKTCVAMCSGSNSIEDKDLARGNHANAYLLKPMGSDEMDEMVKDLRNILTSLDNGLGLATSF